MDLITKLPVSRSHDLVLVVCDRFSKMSHFIATVENIIVEGLERLFKGNNPSFSLTTILHGSTY